MVLWPHVSRQGPEGAVGYFPLLVSALLLWDRFFHWTWRLSSWLGWLAIKFAGSAHLCSLKLACVHLCWGFELRTSCLCKCSQLWNYLPSPETTYFMRFNLLRSTLKGQPFFWEGRLVRSDERPVTLFLTEFNPQISFSPSPLSSAALCVLEIQGYVTGKSVTNCFLDAIPSASLRFYLDMCLPS